MYHWEKTVGNLGRERESRVGKLGWHGNFNTGFESNIILLKILRAGFFEHFSEIATIY